MPRRGEKKKKKKRWSEVNERYEQTRRSPRLCVSVSSSSSPVNSKNKKAFHGSMSSKDQSTHNQEHEVHHQGHTDESLLPEKTILKLVLDTLQRRDTYEIFAEPVDPSEVEEYYEIIKEPMDFGTMRAKLHEGMYKNLQQFEHDVFLIFGNAMHFNSSSSVYFRQARALKELAKKAFHVLRNDPKNFELEFAATRRKTSRGIYGESKDSNFGSRPKLDRDLQSNNMTINIGRRGGCKRERRAFVSGMDRRATYKPWTLLDDKSSTISPSYYEQRPAIQMINNREELSYQESLMLFVKDLGPTAKRVAKRKLQELHMQTSPKYKPIEINKITEGPNEGSKPVENPLGFSRFLALDKVKEGKSSVVGKFDLNEVGCVSSELSPTIVCNSKANDFVTIPMHGNFIFNVPYLKSRMRELNDLDHMRHCYSSQIPTHTHSFGAWFR